MTTFKPEVAPTPAAPTPAAPTRVLNLATGESIFYSIPPERAVIAAYEQFARKNWNTWGYLLPEEHPQYVRTARCHTCGDFTALAAS